MIKLFFRGLILMIAPLLLGCYGSQAESNDPQEYLLLWHSWNEAEAAGLARLIDNYEAIHPEVEVIVSSFASDEELLLRFKNEAQLGLGPDLLLGPSDWVPELVEAGLLQNLAERPEPVDVSNYLSAAVDTLRVQEGLYGLPMTLDLVALYYNRDLADDSPPQRLETLLVQASEGQQKVALSTNFDRAFWGVKAFGGQLFDTTPSERLRLNQGGFANWLNWLRQAQDNPNIILDSDEEALYNLFQEGQVSYYVGKPDVLYDLQQSLGEAEVGVAPLPAGPNGPSGPFLRTEALMFNAWSSPSQAEGAFRLARFLTGVEQQTRLARQEVPLIPANSRVRVNPQVYPAVAGFLAQSKTAVPVPNLPQMQTLFQYGNEAYIQALSGTEEPSQVANNLTQRVNEAHGLGPVDLVARTTCPTSAGGTLSMWHPWQEPEAVVLAQIARRFTDLCPEIAVELTAYPANIETSYRQAVRQGQGPDLLLASSTSVASLAEAQLIQPITAQIEPAVLQQYLLAAQQTMRYQNNLYGLPVTMQLMALYYKSEQVTDPPRVVEDLLTQAAPERQVALPVTFQGAFWGLTAFGGLSGNPDTSTIFLEEEGFAAWLAWLQQAQARPGVHLSQDLEELLTLFVEGEAIYFAGHSSQLGELRQRLGRDQVRVVPLPAGPINEASPLLTTEGIMLNPTVDEAQQSMGLAFARYLTGVESQTMLQQRAAQLPVNVNVSVDRTEYPLIAGFLDQAQTALPQANYPNLETIWAAGDILYEAALEEEVELEEAIETFFEVATDGSRIVRTNEEVR